MMMRAGFVLVIGAIACGGGNPTPPPQKPEPGASTSPPAPVPESGPTDPMDGSGGVAPPAPEAAPPAPRAPLRDRLHDEDGPVAGMPGWNLKRLVDANVCGGTRVVVSRGRRKLDPDQTALAKLYDVPFPAGLDFDPAAKAKQQASLKRFNAYVEQLTKVGAEARERYTKVVADKSAELAARTAAAARIAQVSLRFAAALARAPIPADVRTGEFAKEKIEAYCS
ncbi:MAG: hypothetical protein ABI678_06605, partial [Kofleriaceae bacterium]